MPKVIRIVMTPEERALLETNAHQGPTHDFRLRCRAVLLKNEYRSSSAVARQLGCCPGSVHQWLKRYRDQGIAGLRIREGRGRKPILQTDTDLAAIRRAVKDRQKPISAAKAEIEQELGKSFCVLTLRRFLKQNAGASS